MSIRIDSNPNNGPANGISVGNVFASTKPGQKPSVAVPVTETKQEPVAQVQESADETQDT